jgi:hypothetical protein
MAFDFVDVCFPIFCAAFRYQRSLHSTTYKKQEDRQWVENYQLFRNQTYRYWWSLPKNQPEIFIHRAKVEFSNFNQGRLHDFVLKQKL